MVDRVIPEPNAGAPIFEQDLATDLGVQEALKAAEGQREFNDAHRFSISLLAQHLPSRMLAGLVSRRVGFGGEEIPALLTRDNSKVEDTLLDHIAVLARTDRGSVLDELGISPSDIARGVIELAAEPEWIRATLPSTANVSIAVRVLVEYQPAEFARLIGAWLYEEEAELSDGTNVNLNPDVIESLEGSNPIRPEEIRKILVRVAETSLKHEFVGVMSSYDPRTDKVRFGILQPLRRPLDRRDMKELLATLLARPVEMVTFSGGLLPERHKDPSMTSFPSEFSIARLFFRENLSGASIPTNVHPVLIEDASSTWVRFSSTQPEALIRAAARAGVEVQHGGKPLEVAEGDEASDSVDKQFKEPLELDPELIMSRKDFNDWVRTAFTF